MKNAVARLAKKYGTPLYLIDTEQLRVAFGRIKGAFPRVTTIAYATKANYAKSVVRTFRDLGASFDVFSRGELMLLLENGCLPERMIYTSASETAEEFRYALSRGIRLFVIGSLGGLANLDTATREAGVTADSLLRVQPLRKCAAGVSASGPKSKFGLTFRGDRDSVENAFLKMTGCNNINFKGFHFHIGSQVESPAAYTRAIDRVLRFAKDNEIGVSILDIGGGYPFRYRTQVPDVGIFGSEIGKRVRFWRGKIGNFRLIIEPGRFLTAGATVLVTAVINVKGLYGKRVIMVDASDDMLSVSSLKSDVNLSTIPRIGRRRIAVIAGNMPHSRDWIVENPSLLPDVDVGGLLVFRGVGAYVVSDNVPCGLRRPAKVIAIRNNNAVLEEHPFQTIARLYGA
jgi:diaminopimelate decarboxylase